MCGTQVSDLATGALEQMLASSETEASAAADLLSFDLVLLAMPEVISTQALDPHALHSNHGQPLNSRVLAQLSQQLQLKALRRMNARTVRAQPCWLPSLWLCDCIHSLFAAFRRKAQHRTVRAQRCRAS